MKAMSNESAPCTGPARVGTKLHQIEERMIAARCSGLLGLVAGAGALASVFLIGAAPANATLDQAVLRTQEGVSALLRGNFERAIDAYDRALADTNLPPGRQASLYNDRGVAKWRLKRYDEALADFGKAIELDPDYSPAYNNRGNVHMELQRYEDAIRDFTSAIELAPAYGAAYNNRANALLALGRIVEAEDDFRRAVELMPTSAVPLNGKGRASGLRERPFQGLRYLSRAILLNQNYPAAYHNRARLYMSLARYDEARSDLDQTLSVSEDAALLTLRARTHAALGKDKTAIEDFNKAIELDDQNAEAFAGRGAALEREGKTEDALADCERAVALNPDLVPALICRARIFQALGQPERVIVDLSRAMELEPDNVDAFLLRARMAENAADFEAAIADYKAAIERDPFNDEARDALDRLSEKFETAVEVPMPVIGEAEFGWRIVRIRGDQFAAISDEYPKLRVRLEMYGAGEPRLLDWTLLTETLRGFGLLRYAAGSPGTGVSGGDEAALEYVAILDLRNDKVVSIEPFVVGTRRAVWEWGRYNVTVTDADGVPSALQLREEPSAVARQPEPRRLEDERWSYDEWRRDTREWRPRDRQRPRRGPTLFDWLFR